MDEAVGFSYTGIGNEDVVVIYWVGRRGEYRNTRLMSGLVVVVVLSPKMGKGSADSIQL